MKIDHLKYIILSIALLQCSCKKFLQIDPPINSLVQSTVFDNNDQATSAVAGIYVTMAASGYASGNSTSVTCLAGLSSDELIGYHVTNIPFYQNQVTPELASLQTLYSGPYQTIYSANAVLEGLSASTKVTPAVKSQLQGEALFLRAFAYFYLVNLYGPVPLQLTTDYRSTQSASRAPIAQIYHQIVTDLTTAENLLSDAYPTSGKARPNKSVVQALLARTYLYLGDWKNAEKYASLVIANSTYKLVDLNSVFLANSQEAIWQLMPTANSNTQDGALFILTTTPIYVSLRADFAQNGFENNDKRKGAWVGNITVNGQTYFFPYKYKVRSSTTVTEYSMVFRLAEQYLIRAEANAQLNTSGNLSLAVADLNMIRTRAGLPNTSATTQAAILTAIYHERQVELFAEWGHRWFDLKRTGNATIVLSLLKSQWQASDILYPIPLNEITRNPNITQNAGY